MSLVQQWRNLAEQIMQASKTAPPGPTGPRMVNKAATFVECADQLDTWLTGLRTLLDSWDAGVRALASETVQAERAQDREEFERLAAQQAQLQRCVAELRKLVDPAPAPAVPIEDQCGEGPHGQPCGQHVIDGVCPDHGEVGP